MDTQNTRLTRAQAATLAKVSTRTISRWSAAGLLNPEYAPPETGSYATYDREEVLRAAGMSPAVAEGP
jgi:DNA-binding transcriptional MerR regulator